MKNSILIAVLGLTVTLATPSLSLADSWRESGNHGFINEKYKNKHHRRQADKHASKKLNKHKYRDKHVAKAKPPKRHHNKFVKRHDNKHYNYKHHEPKTSFSITFGNDFPNIVYSEHYPERYDYKNNRRYNGLRIYERQDKQARRIRKGIKKGQLVRREVRRLRDEQRHIDSKLAYFKRDGRLNRHERAKLHHMLDVASDNIRHKRHNRLTRDSRNRQHNYDYAWH